MTVPRSQWASAVFDDYQRNRRRRDRRRFWVLATIALFVVAGGTALLVRVHAFPDLSFWNVRRVEISGNRTVPEGEIARLLGFRSGDPWWKYDRSSIAARVSQHPSVGRLDLHYAWFHRLSVEVTEKEPVLAVLPPSAGEITGDGWVLPPRPAAEAVDLPILRSSGSPLPGAGSRTRGHAASIARLVESLRESRPDVYRDLSEIEIQEDEAYAYLRSCRAMIRFLPGVHESLWQNVSLVLDDLGRRGRDDAVLDLRFGGRIVVHLPEPVASDSSASQAQARYKAGA